MGLQALGFGRGGEDRGFAAAGKKDEKRDGAVGGAEDSPIGGAAAFKARVDDIFRAVRFVGLGNEAAAARERILYGGRELWKRIHRKMSDKVWGGAAGDGDLARDIERRRGRILGPNAREAEGKKQRDEEHLRFESRANHEKVSGALYAQRRRTATFRDKNSIAQRLAGLEGEGDALLSLALAAKGEKGLAFQIEDVLLADEGAGSDAAAGQDVCDPAGHFLVVLGGVARFAHEIDAGFERGQCGRTGSGDLGAGLRRNVAGIGQRRSLRFGVQKQALTVHGDAIGGRKHAERARIGR